MMPLSDLPSKVIADILYAVCYNRAKHFVSILFLLIHWTKFLMHYTLQFPALHISHYHSVRRSIKERLLILTLGTTQQPSPFSLPYGTLQRRHFQLALVFLLLTCQYKSVLKKSITCTIVGRWNICKKKAGVKKNEWLRKQIVYTPHLVLHHSPNHAKYCNIWCDCVYVVYVISVARNYVRIALECTARISTQTE